MAFKSGKDAVVLFDQYNLSAYLNAYDATAEVDLPETTTFGSSARRRTVVGQKDGSMTLGGFHEAAAGGTQPVLTTALAAASANVVTVGVEGAGSIGLPANLMSARERSYKSGSPVDGVVPVSVELTGDGGVDMNGKFLKALGATTATGDSTSVDNGASSANGGVAHIHATAVSGTPTLDAKVQHSTDDSVWVDLVTFTQLAAAGKQRSEVAAGTTVNRYLRETHTVGGGSPSITYAVAFARR